MVSGIWMVKLGTFKQRIVFFSSLKTGIGVTWYKGTRAVAALRLLVGKKAKKARRRLKGAKAPPFFQEPF